MTNIASNGRLSLKFIFIQLYLHYFEKTIEILSPKEQLSRINIDS